MSQPQTGTSTLERTDTEIDPTTGEPRLSHLVAPKDGKTGAVLAMEARFNGTPVTALCGHTFVPSRDPQAFPVCQACNEILKIKTGEEHGDQVPQG